MVFPLGPEDCIYNIKTVIKMNGYMYILKCSNGLYYTGSTKDLDKRIVQHFNGEGSNFTRKNTPIELVYYEEFERIDYAFQREKQVQKWSKKKKEALIRGDIEELKTLSTCKNRTHCSNHAPLDSARGP